MSRSVSPMGSDRDLPESEMIHEPRSQKPLWIFLSALLLIFGILWGIEKWEGELLLKKRAESPFLRVTNREFSLFLWQNPEFMRRNMKSKFGYLPHFDSSGQEQMIPEFADDYIAAPPLVIFRYHVWHRLIGDSLAFRPISIEAFENFLKENKEWMPEYWKQAPEEYRTLVSNLSNQTETNLQRLSFKQLPFEVRMAFQGWFNYIYEWEKIQNNVPTQGELVAFLRHHPTYNRFYWRNILEDSHPNYLKSFPFGPPNDGLDQERTVSEEELSTFLRVGLYNFSFSTMTNPSS